LLYRHDAVDKILRENERRTGGRGKSRMYKTVWPGARNDGLYRILFFHPAHQDTSCSPHGAPPDSGVDALSETKNRLGTPSFRLGFSALVRRKWPSSHALTRYGGRPLGDAVPSKITCGRLGNDDARCIHAERRGCYHCAAQPSPEKCKRVRIVVYVVRMISVT
jgi:hypothetical protein